MGRWIFESRSQSQICAGSLNIFGSLVVFEAGNGWDCPAGGCRGRTDVRAGLTSGKPQSLRVGPKEKPGSLDRQEQHSVVLVDPKNEQAFQRKLKSTMSHATAGHVRHTMKSPHWACKHSQRSIHRMWIWDWVGTLEIEALGWMNPWQEEERENMEGEEY